MKVLVTGAGGFVGSAVCAQLQADGLGVRGTYRKCASPETNPPTIYPSATAPERVEVGDINAATQWGAALDGVDAVVHLAARVHSMDDPAVDPMDAFREVNVAGTRRLAQAAAKAGVKRFVFISSIKVNGEQTVHLMTERKHADARGRPYNSMFSERDEPAPEDSYGQSKHEAEIVLREIEASSGMEVVILRPPLLYGPGVKANFLKLIKLVDKEIPLVLGGIQNQRSLLSLSNLAALISVCVSDARAAGHTFTVCDGEDVSTAELVRRIAAALGKKARLINLPEGLMRFAGKLTRRSAQVDRLCGSLVIDSSHAREVLDWNPPFTMEQELAKLAVWYRSELPR
jgi:nucleoside-diphosphate-sugar epimerase